MVSIDAVLQDLVEQLNDVLQPNLLSYLHQVLAADTPKLRVVQQQISELGALLHKI